MRTDSRGHQILSWLSHPSSQNRPDILLGTFRFDGFSRIPAKHFLQATSLCNTRYPSHYSITHNLREPDASIKYRISRKNDSILFLAMIVGSFLFPLFFLFATWLLFMNRIFIFVFSFNPRNAGYHSHLITHGSIQIFSFILFHFFPSFATYFTTHGSIQKNFIPRYSFIQKWVSQTTIFPYRPTVLVFPLDIRYFEYLWANFFRIDPRLLVFHLIFTISSITEQSAPYEYHPRHHSDFPANCQSSSTRFSTSSSSTSFFAASRYFSSWR